MKTTIGALVASAFTLAITVPYITTNEIGSAQALSVEQSKKWEVLFDGGNLEKWRQSAADKAPGDGWVVENGSLSAIKGRKGGDIITKETYQDFELQCEFKLTKAANSGIKYHVTSIQNAKTKKSTNMGIEYQIIDDNDYPEIKDDPYGVSSTGAVYLLYPPKGKKLPVVGEWNKVKIVSKGKRSEHWLNGVKLVTYERGTADFAEKVAATKFKDYPDYGKIDKGHIMITDHGDQVFFKNIRVRRL